MTNTILAAVHHFAIARRAAAAVEFALLGLAFFAFLLTILNLGMLGFSLAALAQGVQGGARAAATYAANEYVANGAYTGPTACQVDGYFNGFADPPLPAAGTGTSSNPRLTINWVNNSSVDLR